MKKLIAGIMLILFMSVAWAETVRTSDYFDYDAIITDPETYKGLSYTIVGSASNVDTSEMDISDWKNPSTAVVAVDGDTGRPVLVMFDNPEDEGMIASGDTVKLFGDCLGATEIQTAVGLYVTMPVFVAHTMESIP